MTDLALDLADPTGQHAASGLLHPADRAALTRMVAQTNARIGVGRAGPRPRTATALRFQADHAVTQDALDRDVDASLIEDLGLLTAQTRVTGGRRQYLLRPDLGRLLSDQAKETLRARCPASATFQIAVGDGLSATALEQNLRVLLPSLIDGAGAEGWTTGTPFFVRSCRVGVLNEIGDLLQPEVVALLIGERPGLGRADALSAYLAFRPKHGDTDAERTVISGISPGGGIAPEQAACLILDTARAMRRHQCGGVRLAEALSREIC